MKRKNAILKIRESKNDLVLSYSSLLRKLLGSYDDPIIENISNQLASRTIELFENQSGIIRVETPKPEKPRKGKGKEKQDWDNRLTWTEPDTRDIAINLKSKIISDIRNIEHQISGQDYLFSKGKRNPRSLFAALRARENPDEIEEAAKLIKISYELAEP